VLRGGTPRRQVQLSEELSAASVEPSAGELV